MCGDLMISGSIICFLLIQAFLQYGFYGTILATAVDKCSFTGFFQSLGTVMFFKGQYTLCLLVAFFRIIVLQYKSFDVGYSVRPDVLGSFYKIFQ